jgi:ACS family hexuronate transporter-like MFS transporter
VTRNAESSVAFSSFEIGTSRWIAVIAPPLIALILTQVDWFGVAPWRWVFFLTGARGIVWTLWWWTTYDVRATEARGTGVIVRSPAEPAVPLSVLLRRREIRGVVAAKFLSDAAWYFYLFWLPKFLFDTLHFDIKAASSVGWIPYAASGVGCLVGGGLSSWLLARGATVDRARKVALGLSAALMPWVMAVPFVSSVAGVIAIFSLAFFGQQSWSTLVMILPTDLVPRRVVGTVAGLVGLGGAMGGVVLGQLAGWLLDHGFSYTPVLITAGSLHLVAFGVICLCIPRLGPLTFDGARTGAQ